MAELQDTYEFAYTLPFLIIHDSNGTVLCHKLRRKKIDLIAVNDIGHSHRGFDVDDNRITLLNGEGLLAELPLASKEAIAHQLMTFVVDAHKSQSGAESNG